METDAPTHNRDEAGTAFQTDGATVAGSMKIQSRWPGWPGDCVFRLIVPVLKVGSIIGRKGELIKKMCDETGARIRVLDAPDGLPDRVVLVSGKEDLDATLSPAMEATMRIFKRVSSLPEGDMKSVGAAGIGYCSVRLLVSSTQAINLIGKQGSLIKSMQESTGASVRILSQDEVPCYVAPDERIAALQGEASKVAMALEIILGHLRKFLVDHSVLPLFEKNYNAIAMQERQVEAMGDKLLMHPSSQSVYDTPLSVKREALFLDRESLMESHLPPSRISLYGQDPAKSSTMPAAPLRTGAPIVTQITQTMQVPISYAEEIIGVGGSNIAYIRRSSGAIITVQEIPGLPDEITVEIKGTSSQVHQAQQLVQDCLSNANEPVSTGYGKYDGSFRSLYSHLDNPPYHSSLSAHSYSALGPSPLGPAYGGYRHGRLA